MPLESGALPSIECCVALAVISRPRPAATAVQEQVDGVARPCIEFDRRHRRTESHGTTLRNPDHQVQELLGCEGRVVEIEVSGSRFELEEAGDEPKPIRGYLPRNNGRELGESRRFTHDQSMKGDRLLGECAPQNEACQPPQDLLEVAAVDEGDVGGWAHAIDDAMNNRSEERRLVVEAMVERSLGYSRPPRNRLDAGGAVSQCQNQMGRRVENPLADLF